MNCNAEPPSTVGAERYIVSLCLKGYRTINMVDFLRNAWQAITRIVLE